MFCIIFQLVEQPHDCNINKMIRLKLCCSFEAYHAGAAVEAMKDTKF